MASLATYISEQYMRTQWGTTEKHSIGDNVTQYWQPKLKGIHFGQAPNELYI